VVSEEEGDREEAVSRLPQVCHADSSKLFEVKTDE